MTNLLIEYPKCTTCQKAKRWLIQNDIKCAYRHIVDENPTYDELKQWWIQSKCQLKKFFNTSGNRYKELNLKEKLPTMTEDEQLKLLATDGMLIKRPLLITPNVILIGFKQNEWEEKLKKDLKITI